MSASSPVHTREKGRLTLLSYYPLKSKPSALHVLHVRKYVQSSHLSTCAGDQVP